MKAGSQELKEQGCIFIVVVGHPEFYPRFGFEPASRYRVTCEWEVPDDVFMLLPLDRDKMTSIFGRANYRSEFSTIS